jgi:hypothetical protein
MRHKYYLDHRYYNLTHSDILLFEYNYRVFFITAVFAGYLIEIFLSGIIN